MKQVILFSLAVFLFSCKSTNVTMDPSQALAPVIIYKTKADYNNLVPVSLDANREKIVSYPAPQDLYVKGELAIPVELNKGYLLDRRGLNAGSAFTSYTYEDYSKLERAPSIEDLLNSIVDPDPFVEIYDCGTVGEYENLEKDLNKLVRNKFDGATSMIQD